MPDSIELSVVIPAFNESTRLPRTLFELANSVARSELPKDIEIIVVNDGSLDRTVDVKPDPSQSIWREVTYRMVSLDRHRGKGAAVREGLRQAKGRWTLLADADLSTPFRMYQVLRSAAVDGAIASRALRGSRITIRQPGLRHPLGRAFNVFVRAVSGLPYRDTQCGFKLLSEKAASLGARYLTLEHFGYDVELLMILKHAHLTVVEVPVEWAHMEDSRVRAYTDGLRMGLSALSLRLGFLMGAHPAARLKSADA